MAAASTQWNSGRLVRSSAIVWPWPSPSPASPAASARTLSEYSPQVMVNSSPLVRSATRSGCSSAVTWKAPQSVDSLSALYSTRSCSVVVASITPPVLGLSPGGYCPEQGERELAGLEAVAGEPADVVREPDEEEAQHQGEPDQARPLHDAERNRPAAHLLDYCPEDVAAVEREEREQVDDRERQRDQRDDAEGLPRVVLDR